MKRIAMMSLGVVVAVCTVNACSSAPEDNLYRCDPDAILPAPACLEQTSVTKDAGTDAESDAATDGALAKDDPGLQSSVFTTCEAACVPEASDPMALGWPNEPLVVWFGPRSELDAKTCPGGTPNEKVRGFNGLVAAPAKCDSCSCLPKGSCTLLPESIELRNGALCTGESLPFDGPANWDGSCTPTNAIAAGTLCNGVLCAQSIHASTLPGPTNESCTPTTQKPNATIPKHEWLEGTLACHAKDLQGTCPNTQHCVETVPDGWHQCLARTGKHDICPNPYNAYAPRWVYQDNPIDDRGCSDCACGTPKNSLCVGSLQLYSDGLCTKQLNSNTIASTGPFCADIVPPGPAIGSKTITNLSYMPGTCTASGGEPIGEAIPNDNENSGVVTICCRAPDPPPPDPPG